MKYLILNLLLWAVPLLSFAQTDCVDAIYVCGNSNFSGLTATGFGIQEIDESNACTSKEHNTLWFKIKIKDGGTLGLIIKPENDDLVVDLDFWIYGPNVSCGSLGMPIRCSTTNPLMIGATDNLTGMNDTETDAFEGPGDDGSGFISQMDVLDNEEYYLVVDRPIGESDFSVQWTGTATFYALPVFNNPDNISTDLHHCDDDGVEDNAIVWDLTTHKAMFIGTQDDVELTYHLSENDATTHVNAIADPQHFINTSAPQVIHMRMTNLVTGCFSTQTFKLVIDPLPRLPLPQPDAIMLCDFNGNGYQSFDIAQHTPVLPEDYPGATITYYASLADAEDEVNPIASPYINIMPYTTQTLYARMNPVVFCDGYGITPFQIGIIPIPDVRFTVSVSDWTLNQNSIRVVAEGDPSYYEYSLDGAAYSPAGFFDGLEAGIYTVYVRTTDYCAVVSRKVALLNYPKFFTPNNDGTHDYWGVPYLNFYPGARITIFDRYGKEVSSFRENDAGWDGTYNGRRLPSTDYWFTADLQNGRILLGHFAMLR